jgi:hypothetical protein
MRLDSPIRSCHLFRFRLRTKWLTSDIDSSTLSARLVIASIVAQAVLWKSGRIESSLRRRGFNALHPGKDPSPGGRGELGDWKNRRFVDQQSNDTKRDALLPDKVPSPGGREGAWKAKLPRLSCRRPSCARCPRRARGAWRLEILEICWCAVNARVFQAPRVANLNRLHSVYDGTVSMANEPRLRPSRPLDPVAAGPNRG